MSAFLRSEVLGGFFGAGVVAAVITFFIRKLWSTTAMGLGAAGWILIKVFRPENNAATALGAFVAAVLCAVLAVVLGVRDRARVQPRTWHSAGAIVLGSLLLVFASIGFVRGLQARPTATEARLRERLAFPQANFAYSVPADFSKVDVPGDAPSVVFSTISLDPPSVSVQIRAWVAPGTTVAELAADAKKVRLEFDPSAAVLAEGPLTVRDLAGQSMRVDSKDRNGVALALLTWSFVSGDHCYAISIWTKRADAKVLEERAKQLLEAFEILDRAGSP